jgi:ribonuclease HII
MALRAYYQRGAIEAGCDEAGRGCLAGPVVAAAVVLPPGVRLPGLNDSKELTARERSRLRPRIEREALAWCVGQASVEEIETLNIQRASFLAMHRAVAGLAILPGLLLIDGDRFIPYFGIAHHCVVRGDAIYRSIAAASILAKTHRDEIMVGLDALHPRYGWGVNMGYPTAQHAMALHEWGPTEHHRRNFRTPSITLDRPTQGAPTKTCA